MNTLHSPGYFCKMKFSYMRGLYIFLFFLSLLSGLTCNGQDLIVFKDLKTITVKVVSLSQDTVYYILPGFGKDQISAIPKDRIELLLFDPQGVKRNDMAIVEKRNRTGGPANALYSAVFPGWGSYYVREKEAPYWLLGALVYGLAGTGLYLEWRSDRIYKDYIKEEGERGTYKNANDLHHAFYYTTGAGILIWTTDILRTVIKGVKNKRPPKIEPSSGSSDRIEPFLDEETGFGLRYKF